MAETSQKPARQNYRRRIDSKHMGRSRFAASILIDFIRLLAKRLSEDNPNAARIRAEVQRTVPSEPPRAGSILRALRRSPLVGADLNLRRVRDTGRKVNP